MPTKRTMISATTSSAAGMATTGLSALFRPTTTFRHPVAGSGRASFGPSMCVCSIASPQLAGSFLELNPGFLSELGFPLGIEARFRQRLAEDGSVYVEELHSLGSQI